MGKTSDKKEYTVANRTYTDLSYLDFTITARNGNSGYNNKSYMPDAYTTPPSAPVYWIDDICVKKLNIEATDISFNGKFTVDFNYEIADSDLTADKFEIYKDGEKLSADGYSISKSADDASNVLVSLNDKNAEGTFRLVAKKGIAAKETKYGVTLEDVSKEVVNKFKRTVLDINFDDGKLPEGIIKNIAGTGTVTVEQDSLTDSNAIKITNEAKHAGLNGFDLPFEAIGSGKAIVEFKIRTENRTALMTSLGVSGTGGWAVSTADCKGNIYLFTGSGLNNKLFNLNNSYQTIKYVIDIDNKTYDAYVNGELKHTAFPFRATNASDISKLHFNAQYSDSTYGAGGAWLPTGEGDAIFWIDDIKVKRQAGVILV